MRKKPIQKPMLEATLSDAARDDDGFNTFPEPVWLANELRLFKEQYDRDNNPLWIWRALNGIEACARSGHDTVYPLWVRNYLATCAAALLTIEPSGIDKDKMPHAISAAVGMTRKGGGPGYVATFHKRFDEMNRALAVDPAIPPDAAAEMRVQLKQARGMRADKQPIEDAIKRGAQALKAGKPRKARNFRD